MRCSGQLRTLVGRLLGIVVCLASVGGCSRGAGDDDAGPTSAPPATATATTAAGGTTPAGTRLRLGASALVHWSPDAAHSSTIRLSVTDVRRGTTKDLDQYNLSDEARSSGVYYVSVIVANAGRGDLSRRQPELFGAVSDDLVVPPVTFGPPYEPCDYQPLPPKFVPGDKARLCMVMLTPKRQRLRAVEWRDRDDVAPVTWVVR